MIKNVVYAARSMLRAETGFFSLKQSRKRASIVGVVVDPRLAKHPVVIRVNGCQIAETATVPVKETRNHSFRREISGATQFLGKGDKLSVEIAGRRLLHVSGKKVFKFKGRSSFGKLTDELNQGKILDKYGRIIVPLRQDEKWKAEIFDQFHALKGLLRKELSLDLFPIYGTLLGAVREGMFIAHDNDFDTVFVSNHVDAESVKQEFLDVCYLLVDNGFKVKPYKTHVHVYQPGAHDVRKLDIFFARRDKRGTLEVSYGWHGRKADMNGWTLDSKVNLSGVDVEVPANYEEILAQLFGEGWRRPDPGFTHRTSEKSVNSDLFLSKWQLNSIYWRQFYRENEISGPSTFAIFIADQIQNHSCVVDVGCGTGRDTLYFASQGHRAHGLDQAADAVSKLHEHASKKNSNGRNDRFGTADFSSLDAADRQQLTDFLSSTVDEWANECSGDYVIYMRFFLHSVPEATEANVISALAEWAPDDALVAMEFRTERDKSRPKSFGKHYRRYIDFDVLCQRLQASLGKVVHCESGTGLSPFRDEDPHLGRILVRVNRS